MGMNVAVLSNLYAPLARGGAERVAELSAQALIAHGCDVHVVTLAAPGARVIEHSEANGVAVHRLPCPNRYHPLEAHTRSAPTRVAWHMRDLRTPATIRLLGTILDDAAIDGVVSHNLKGLGMRCLEAVRARGLPHVHVLHDLQLSVASGVMWWGGERRGAAHPWFRRWHERQTRQVVGSPRAVVAPSKYLLDEHVGRGFFPLSKSAVLRNPVVPMSAEVTPRHGPARVAFLGQLVVHKGLRVLLKAWAARRRDAAMGGAELHVAGDGPLAAEVRAAAKDDPSLVYHGRLDVAGVRSLLESSDAVVLPSIWYENAPLAVLEALGVGCAVIASRIGGVPELLDADCGYLVAPDNPQALAAAVGNLVDDLPRWRSQRAAIAGRRHGPTPSEHAEALLALLRSTPE